MDNIKKFFKKKKLDVRFQQAGTGHSLTAPTPAPQNRQGPAPINRSGPGLQSQMAAAAAMERIQAVQPQQKSSASQRAIINQARRELDSEAAGVSLAGGAHSFVPPSLVNNEPEFDHSPLLVDGVFFTCDLLGDDIILPKDIMAQAIEQFLVEQLDEDRIVSSVVMIYSLCTSRDARITCIDTILKYLDNIIEMPKEPKFRRIRIANKAFQERVMNVKGGREFLTACGFVQSEESQSEGGQMEPFLVLKSDPDVPKLVQAKETLLQGEGVPLRVYRNPQILSKETRPLSDFRVPDDFYSMSSEEVKREQAAKIQMVDKLETLRTKEMRSKDSYRPKYKYVLLRIRFPNATILQGLFGSSEPASHIFEFVREHLKYDWAMFTLKCCNIPLEDTNSKDLNQMQLAPAALIMFDMEKAMEAQIIESLHGMKLDYLKDED